MIFSTFLIFRARPLFCRQTEKRGGKYAGGSSKVSTFSTRIFRRLHASDPVFSRAKTHFTTFQQFQQSYIYIYYILYNTRNKTIRIYNNKTPPYIYVEMLNSIYNSI